MVVYHIAVALVLFLFSVCHSVGAEDLQPPIYRSYKANGGGNLKQRSIIRGLLKRQYYCDPGYGFCTNRGQCCPTGGDCCNDGNCCPPGQYCGIPGYCCYNGQYICENTSCCNKNEPCCSDGGCCYSGYYCAVGTDGKVGCCPNGKICSGPVGGGNTPPPTKATPTTTLQTSQMTSSTIASVGTPAPLPSTPPGSTEVIINADDPSITWSSKWTLGDSSCYESELSMKTTLTNQSLTYITPSNATASIYLDVSWDGVTFNILIDGVKFSLSLTTVPKCDYFPIPIDTGTPHNITIYTSGQSGSGKQIDSSSSSPSFEFNRFVFGEQLSTTTSSIVATLAATPSTTTGSGLSNSAGRMGPGGITVAAGALLCATMMSLL